jgi:hypothetical protein
LSIVVGWWQRGKFGLEGQSRGDFARHNKVDERAIGGSIACRHKHLSVGEELQRRMEQ